MTKKHDVGFSKPPQHSQFKPGQSGNPKGRPKGSRNLRSDLEEELYGRVVVTQGGKKQSISRQRALVKTLIGKALHSDTKSISVLLNLMMRLLPPTEELPLEVDLSESDKAILRAYEERVRQQLKSKPGQEK